MAKSCDHPMDSIDLHDAQPDPGGRAPLPGYLAPHGGSSRLPPPSPLAAEAAAAAMMPSKRARSAHLSEDVMIEILARLPAKSVARFRCVSRRWRAILSDREYFLRLHSSRSSLPVSGFFVASCGDCSHGFLHLNGDLPRPADHTLSFLRDAALCYRFTVVGSCAGLLLCRTDRRVRRRFSLIVCDPHAETHVPVDPVPAPARMARTVGLAVDPSRFPAGFRVVAAGDSACHVYYSETRTWKPLPLACDFSGVYREHGAYWNGALVWMRRDSPQLVALDVEGERVRAVPPPPIVKGPKWKCFCFGESGGHLHLIRSSNRSGVFSKKFDILGLRSFDSEWSVLYHVDISRYPYNGVRRWAGASISLLCLVRDERGDGDGDLILLQAWDKFFSYHLRKKRFQKLCDRMELLPYGPKRVNRYSWLQFQPYAYTLFSL